MVRALLFLYAESPVHAGGDASVGGLDLPIQREASTGLPVIWGQSLKGALRSHARARWGKDSPKIVKLFGDPPPAGSAANSPRPGALSIGDAQLVAFPVPTLLATFAWVTSPFVLSRLHRKADLVSVASVGAAPAIPAATDQTALAATAGWVSPSALFGAYLVDCVQDDASRKWAGWIAGAALPTADTFGFFRDKLCRDLVTVGDSLMVAVSRECAEVTPRVQLDDTEKTVNGLFYVEYLPAEVVLAAIVEADDGDRLHELATIVDHQVIHIGGDETIGKGLVWCRFMGLTPGPGDTATANDGAGDDPATS